MDEGDFPGLSQCLRHFTALTQFVGLQEGLGLTKSVSLSNTLTFLAGSNSNWNKLKTYEIPFLKGKNKTLQWHCALFSTV